MEFVYIRMQLITLVVVKQAVRDASSTKELK